MINLRRRKITKYYLCARIYWIYWIYSKGFTNIGCQEADLSYMSQKCAPLDFEKKGQFCRSQFEAKDPRSDIWLVRHKAWPPSKAMQFFNLVLRSIVGPQYGSTLVVLMSQILSRARLEPRSEQKPSMWKKQDILLCGCFI